MNRQQTTVVVILAVVLVVLGMILFQRLSISESEQFQNSLPSNIPSKNEQGIIKYELVDYEYLLPDGKSWDRMSPAKNLKTTSNEIVRGVVLAQLIEKRKLKLEAFPGRTASEISGFTINARIYER